MDGLLKTTLIVDVLCGSYASLQSMNDLKVESSHNSGPRDFAGACRDFVAVTKSQAFVLELESEVRNLAQLQQLDTADRLQARERLYGAVWQLSDFDREVLLRQLADESHSAREDSSYRRMHGNCFEIALNGSVFWDGCSANTSRCYLPYGYQPSEDDSPQHKLQSLEILEDRYTEVVLRSGLNTPPCCRFHIIELLFAVRALLQKNQATWQVADGTLLSALRVGEVFPWEYDADINIRDDENGTALRNSLLEALSALGYKVEVVHKTYWLVYYSTSNTIYLDVFWESVRIFDSKFGTVLKQVELHGIEFPYFENPARTYGYGWMIPNRGPECVDRCSSAFDGAARLRCTCTCAREDAAVVDARWNLKRWHLHEHFDGHASTLAKEIIQDVASREEVLPGKACQIETSELPDDPVKLGVGLSADATLLMQFLEFNSGRTVTCEDVKGYCFGWFGNLIRSACPATCGLSIHWNIGLNDEPPKEPPSVIGGVIFACATAAVVFVGSYYV